MYMLVTDASMFAQLAGEEMYRRALRAYQAYFVEIKSIHRDTAAQLGDY
jgi:hypothetical protein